MNPNEAALVILISSTFFSILWILDAFTHERLVKIDITDRELLTHRTILLASFWMELSLIGMYFSPWIALPFFIAGFITRTAHEFIDEYTFHVHRCTPYETFLHLGMWLTVLTKTIAMFLWGFLSSFQGIFELPLLYYIWGFIVFSVMGYTAVQEWNRH